VITHIHLQHWAASRFTGLRQNLAGIRSTISSPAFFFVGSSLLLIRYGVVLHGAVAAGALGGVERLVGPGDQAFTAVGTVRSFSHAQADGDRNEQGLAGLPARSKGLRRDTLAKTLGQLQGLGNASFRQNDDELVAAISTSRSISNSTSGTSQFHQWNGRNPPLQRTDFTSGIIASHRSRKT